MENNQKGFAFFSLIKYPCFKFMLHKAQNELEAREIQRGFVMLLNRSGMSNEEIKEELIGLHFICRLKDIDFDKWPFGSGSFSDVVDAILMDPAAPKYRTCEQLYRKYDSRKTACKLCCLSKHFCNRFYAEEENVVSYALQSEENYNFISAKGITAECFCSYIDVLSDMAETIKPILYSKNKALWHFLSDPVFRQEFYKTDIKEDREIVLSKYFVDDVSKLRLPSQYSEYHYIRSLSEIWSEEICSKEVSGVDIDKDILAILPKEMESLNNYVSAGTTDSHSAQKKTAEKCNLGIDSLDNSFYETPAKGKKKAAAANKSKKGAKNSPVSENPGKGNVSQEEVVVLSLESIIGDTINPDTPSESEGHAEKASQTVPRRDASKAKKRQQEKRPETDANTRKETKHSASNENKELQFLSIVPSRFEVMAPAPPSPPEIHIREIEEIHDTELVWHPDNDTENMVVIPIVPLGELRHFAINLDECGLRILRMFYDYVVKDKHLPLEVIRTDDGTIYYLFFCHPLHAFFYTNLTKKIVFDTVKPLLAHNSITKICYYPYAVTGTAWQQKVYIKNIQSLFSMSSILYEKHKMEPSLSLETLGCSPTVGGITVKPEGPINSIPVKYLPSYKRVYHHNRHIVIKSGLWNEFQLINQFDALLGLSFKLPLDAAPQLYFKITRCGVYSFRKELPAIQVPEHSYYKYSFRNVNGGLNEFIRGALCSLEGNGSFRRFGFSIAGMDADGFILLLSNSSVDDVQTVINCSLLNYLKEQQLRGITYIVEKIKE